MHVVGGVVGIRHDAVEFEIFRCDLWFQSRVDHRRVVKCVGRQELQEFAYIGEGLLLGVHDLVDVAIPSLIISAAELIQGDVLTGDVLDDIGSGDEHVALVAHRDHQIGLDRRIHRTARALAEDDRNLRHHTGEQFVTTAELGVPGKRGDGVLDASAAAVINADDGAADHGNPLHQAGHLAAEHFSHRATEHGLVVRENPDRAAVDGAVPGDHAVSKERVGITRRASQRADFQEAARVE